MCHVLAIEDEPLIADYVCDLASDAGATSTDIASTPSEALAMALARTPAVIMSDVNIIDGTGREAVAEIRRQLGPPPVIFITGTPETCQPCEYAAAVFTKPVVAHHVVGAFRLVAPAEGSVAGIGDAGLASLARKRQRQVREKAGHELLSSH